jgi:hypothetical protein
MDNSVTQQKLKKSEHQRIDTKHDDAWPWERLDIVIVGAYVFIELNTSN